MQRKKRILFVTEATWLNTGYAIYSKRLMDRLYSLNNYELFELSCFGDPKDNRRLQVPWKHYPNLPANEEEVKEYESNIDNSFGAWKFENVCLNCKPDIVLSIADPWMNKYQHYSPFRNCYNLIHMLPLDGIPLEEEWVADYSLLDGILTYTDWGANVVKNCININKFFGVAPGGADNDFRPIQNKKQHKINSGLNPNSIIIGMVSRNQPRKLFYKLLEDFSVLLNSLDKEYKERIFLYLHTAYPDIGWDIPRLLNEYNIGHKVLFTYACKQCGFVHASIYKNTKVFCNQCKSDLMILPRADSGIDSNTLSAIYNLFDIYVQYANMEGLGLAQVEAAYCGIPILSVNYSGMVDIIQKIKALPVDPVDFTIDQITGRKTAVPNQKHFVEQVKKLIFMPDNLRLKFGMNIRTNALKHFNWEDTCNNWIKAINSCQIKNNWNNPPRLHNIPPNYPDGMNNEQFVRWAFMNIAGRPDLCNSYLSMKILRDLDQGFTSANKFGPYQNDMSMLGYRSRLSNYDRNIVCNELALIGQIKNVWEQKRCSNQ